METNQVSGTETIEAIKNEAHRRLAAKQHVELSPEAIATGLCVSGEAVTRHFPTREELLTALILDAYNAMGDSAEKGSEAAAGGTLIDRWVGACRGVRTWAQANPQKYELIWGPPLPDYDAPPETMIVGARTAVLLIGLLRSAMEDGTLNAHPDDPPVSPGMRCNIAAVAEGLMAGLPEPVIARTLIAWTQLLGMLSFAVYGHVQGFAAAPDAYFDHAAGVMAEFCGLTR